jgi:hypothetical protein
MRSIVPVFNHSILDIIIVIFLFLVFFNNKLKLCTRNNFIALSSKKNLLFTRHKINSVINFLTKYYHLLKKFKLILRKNASI